VELHQPLVFLPGTLCDERVWMPSWKHLELSQRAYVPLQWAQDLPQMLALTGDRVDVFEQKVHLVGFSMGGYVASLYALANPHRVASLTLVGYCPEGLTEQEMAQRKLTLQHVAKGHKVTMTPARLAHFVAEQNIENASVIYTIRDMESDLGSAVLAYQIKATTPRQELTSLLGESRFPLNLILGEHDQIAPLAKLQDVARVIAHSRLVVLARAAHMLPLEQPELLAKALYTCLSTS
jgi:pimeloyl-ACP methyl ester carboxylesterase